MRTWAIDQAVCKRCQRCVRSCPHHALSLGKPVKN
jgi:ferredoxin